eukprot:tig00020610_g11979.t1
MKRQMKSTGSGFAISDRRVITNAHCVADATSVMVRKHGSAEKILAKVEHVGHECDLAILTVQDDKFWEGIQPLELGGVPHLQDSVQVVGYPTGGDAICVTSGVVSRVEVQTYTHANGSLLAIQIDAAINSGNSGGPALRNGEVIGVAFETLKNADNIGYIIPTPVVRHFLEDIKRNGTYSGFPSLGCYWQAIESDFLRKSVQLPPGKTGVFVNKIQPLAAAKAALSPGDVLLSVNGVTIASDGTIPFRKAERVGFRYLISERFCGEVVKVGVLRNGKEMEVDVELSLVKPLVPVHLFDVFPSYYIFGGLVFVVLSQPYLRNEYGKDWETKAPVKLCALALDGELNQPDQHVVLLSQVLASEINVGYQLNMGNIVLSEFNGVKINNIKQLAALVESNNEPFAKFLLENEKVIVLDTAIAKSQTPNILRQHAIPAAMSVDIYEGLQPKKPMEDGMHTDKALEAQSSAREQAAFA